VSGGIPRNVKTGRSYRGGNIISLWCTAEAMGFGDPRWGTYRQWQSLGAQVKRGERGAFVIYFQEAGNSEQASDGASLSRRLVTRVSVVFNIAQVENFTASDTQPAPIEEAPDFDDFLARTGAEIRVGGDRAFYSTTTDQIQIPPRGQFKSHAGYAATVTHELIHWTGAKTRLDRDLSGRFGQRAYAAEELIAELGAAFCLAALGLKPEPNKNHAAYIRSWLPLLRDDPKALFVAASQASIAVDWLIAKAQPARQEAA